MKDLREFIATCEKEGELKRIKAEVDWNLELSHIAKLNEEKRGPALLFENVKGYSVPVLTSAMTTERRLAITLEMPLDYSICDMGREWMKRTGANKLLKPKIVDKTPVTEVVTKEKDVDLLKEFPVPKFYPLDGGRYIGTA